jgi:tryptophanyl-tRNA synthetase
MVDWRRLEHDHELYIIVDDLIAAILYPHARNQLQHRTLQVAKEFVATGVDFQRSHLVLTSMVPEVHELCLFTSLAMSQAWCSKLYRESFAGLLTAYQRKELGLPRLATMAEVNYPQLHLATMTLGLGAHFFQGGEEMKGYLPILECIVQHMKDKSIHMPAFMPGKSTFVLGIDGQHMASENAVYLSSDDRTVAEQIAKIKEPRILARICAAVGLEDISTQVLVRSSQGAADAIFKQASEGLVELLRPFRNANTMPTTEVTEILERSAISARERVRETLIRVKGTLGIPGYV